MPKAKAPVTIVETPIKPQDLEPLYKALEWDKFKSQLVRVHATPYAFGSWLFQLSPAAENVDFIIEVFSRSMHLFQDLASQKRIESFFQAREETRRQMLTYENAFGEPHVDSKYDVQVFASILEYLLPSVLCALCTTKLGLEACARLLKSQGSVDRLLTKHPSQIRFVNPRSRLAQAYCSNSRTPWPDKITRINEMSWFNLGVCSRIKIACRGASPWNCRGDFSSTVARALAAVSTKLDTLEQEERKELGNLICLGESETLLQL